MHIRLLTPELRRRLKKPIGELIRGSVEETVPKVKAILKGESPAMLITVGDQITKSMLEAGVKPDVIVVDGRIMRKPTEPLKTYGRTVLKARNPAGTISDEAWNAVWNATRRGDCTVLVDGEEDLLTLVAVLAAPEGSIILYGQPNEGVVAVRATKEKKKEVQSIIDEMERRENKIYKEG